MAVHWDCGGADGRSKDSERTSEKDSGSGDIAETQDICSWHGGNTSTRTHYKCQRGLRGQILQILHGRSVNHWREDLIEMWWHSGDSRTLQLLRIWWCGNTDEIEVMQDSENNGSAASNIFQSFHPIVLGVEKNHLIIKPSVNIQDYA